MPIATALPALASAVAVASLTGDSFDARGYPTIEVAWRLLTLSAGTASLQIEHSEDNEDWEALGEPILLNGPNKVRGQRWGAFRWVRLKLTVSGGGLATFKVTANALQTYATPDDLHDVGIRAEALANISLATKLNGLTIGSDEALSALMVAPCVTLPLKGWTGKLRSIVARIAAYHLRSAEGYQPSKEEENALRQRYLDARADLEMVKTCDLIVAVDPDSGLMPAGDGPPIPEIYSDKPWGF